MTVEQETEVLNILKPLVEGLQASGIADTFKVIYLNQNRKLEVQDLLKLEANNYYGCILTEPAFVLGVIAWGVFQNNSSYDIFLNDKEKYFLQRGFLTTINDFIHLSDYRPTGTPFIVQI